MDQRDYQKQFTRRLNNGFRVLKFNSWFSSMNDLRKRYNMLQFQLGIIQDCSKEDGFPGVGEDFRSKKQMNKLYNFMANLEYEWLDSKLSERLSR